MGEPGGEDGAEGDADGEDGKEHGHHLLGAAERVLHERREEGDDHDADGPEPRDHQAGPPDGGVGPGAPQQPDGRAQDVAVDDECGRRLAGRGDGSAGAVAEGREAKDRRREDRGAAAAGTGKAGEDRAEQDGEERRAFDERVAGGQFLAGEMIGEDAVFDRPEERGDHAEEQHGEEEHRDGMKGEARDRHGRGADLGEFQALRYQRLVVAVGDLTADAGEKEEGDDEERARQRHQHAGVRRVGAGADAEEEKEDQRVLQEVVVEGRKELRPEQRREAPGGHQRAEHLASSRMSLVAGQLPQQSAQAGEQRAHRGGNTSGRNRDERLGGDRGRPRIGHDEIGGT